MCYNIKEVAFARGQSEQYNVVSDNAYHFNGGKLIFIYM